MHSSTEAERLEMKQWQQVHYYQPNVITRTTEQLLLSTAEQFKLQRVVYMPLKSRMNSIFLEDIFRDVAPVVFLSEGIKRGLLTIEPPKTDSLLPTHVLLAAIVVGTVEWKKFIVDPAHCATRASINWPQDSPCYGTNMRSEFAMYLRSKEFELPSFYGIEEQKTTSEYCTLLLKDDIYPKLKDVNDALYVNSVPDTVSFLIASRSPTPNWKMHPLVREFMPSLIDSLLVRERKRFKFFLDIGRELDDLVSLDDWVQLESHLMELWNQSDPCGGQCSIIIRLHDVPPSPGWKPHTWNQLAIRAVQEKVRYLYPVSDFVGFELPEFDRQPPFGWLEEFVRVLDDRHGYGVVGPNVPDESSPSHFMFTPRHISVMQQWKVTPTVAFPSDYKQKHYDQWLSKIYGIPTLVEPRTRIGHEHYTTRIRNVALHSPQNNIDERYPECNQERYHSYVFKESHAFVSQGFFSAPPAYNPPIINVH
jgi:hypothetical protein